MTNYTIIYHTCTDDEPEIRYLQADDIRKLIKDRNLSRWDYAIVAGPVLKSFDSQLDIKKL